MKVDYNIVFIRNFVEVANTGNITGAAEKLFITQSTLSRQLQSLEEMLNITLFKRVKSGVELTKDGFAFYKRCIRLIQSYDEFVSGTAMEFKKVLSGSLRIAEQKAGEDIFIRLNSSFLKAFPYVEIHNQRQESQNLLETLISRDLDLVFLYGGELERRYKNIKSMQVGELDNMLLVSRTNPLSELDSIHLSKLKNERFILPSKTVSPCRMAEIQKKCDELGFVPKGVSYANSIVDYMLEIVRYDGVAIMPYIPNINQNLFKYLKLEGYPQKYPIHVAWSDENSNPILQVYLNHIKNMVEQLYEQHMEISV